MNDKQELWEILVPASYGKTRFTMEHHWAWDEFVKNLTGGLTVMRAAKGTWISPDGEEYLDRIIPVRIAVKSRDILDQIIDFTIKHYEQEAVMAYLISEDVIIKHKNEL